METFSALLALCAGNSPATGEFPSQRPVTRSFDVFFDLKRLSKQSWGWWFETLSRPLWGHCYETPTHQTATWVLLSSAFKVLLMSKNYNLLICRNNGSLLKIDWWVALLHDKYPGPIYPTKSLARLLMTWLRRMELMASAVMALIRHQMETFSALLPFVRGIHRLPVNSPHKGQWRGALMFSLICVWTNGWVNNREAGDLRRHGAHSDFAVMVT